MNKRHAILGALWGDEGKGHITHAFSPNYDWVIRFNGGANAGHTIYRDDKKYVHNLLPSVDYRNKRTKSYLGAGMVIDLEKLRDEVYDTEENFPGAAKNIYVDRNAFIVLDEYKTEDKATNAHIGSTNRGIGPAYTAKIGRRGVRINDLYRIHSGFHDPYYNDFMYQLVGKGVNFVHTMEMEKEFEQSDILFEGAQGIMLDINHGVYPYVSSSDCTVSGIMTSGFGKFMPSHVWGVCKVYLTKVGEGPMPTELKGIAAESLRQLGNEYGATTGRPRRVGWLDLPALRYAIAKSGITELIFTKFDILNGAKEITVCDRYEKEPVCGDDFFDAKPNFTKIPGWIDSQDIEQLQPFIDYIEQETGIDIDFISRGTNITDIISLLPEAI